MSRRAVVICALVLATGGLYACKRDPQAVKAAAIQSGDQLMAAKQYGRAVTAYRRAVTADPDDGLLRVKLAKAHEQAGQWTPAANEAMRAADLLPGDFDVRFLAARLIMGQSRFEDALQILTALLRERPTDVDLLVLWGTASARLINPVWAVYKLGATGALGRQYEEGCTNLRPAVGPDQDQAAEYVLRRAIELAPASVDARLALVSFLWAARRPDESAELLRTLADEQPYHALVNETAGHFFLARRQYALGEKYLTNAAASVAPFNRAPRLALADYYLQSDHAAKALTLLAQTDAADNEGGVISARRADAEIQLGRYDNAAKELDAILAKYPKHPRGLALRALLLLKTGKTSDALFIARESVASDSRSAEARVVLAETLSTLGDLDGAFTEYAEALRLDPRRIRLVPILARLGLATGRDRSALLYARQAAGLFPDDQAAMIAVVTAQVRLRDYAAASLSLAPLLQLRPRPPDVDVQLGLLETARGNDAVARAAFEDALRTRPDSLAALSGLVSLELDRRQIAAARRRIDEAVANRIDDPGVLKIASRVFRAERDLQGAETVLRRALRMQPGDTETALLLADCLVARNRYDDAERLLDEVLERQPSSMAAQVAMGTVLERMERLNEAQARYERVLADDPGAAKAAARLALLAVSRHTNLDVVLTYLTEARRTSPDDADVSDALGWVYLHKGLDAQALRNLEDAVRGNPRHPLYQYHLGVAFARLGQTQKARVALAQSLALDPAFADRPDAEAALAALPR